MSHLPDNVTPSGAAQRGGDIVQLFPSSERREPPREDWETHGPPIVLRDMQTRGEDGHPSCARRRARSRAVRDATMIERSQEPDAAVWVVCAIAFVALAVGFIL